MLPLPVPPGRPGAQPPRRGHRHPVLRWLRRGPLGTVASVLTNEKSFDHPLVGARWANRLGLHAARVRLSERCAAWRRAHQPALDPELAARLERDGLLLIEDALPPDVYAAARAEFDRVLAEQAAAVPVPPPTGQGFGAPRHNPHGFDRYDGGTLNRFVAVDDRCPTIRRVFGPDGWGPRLQALCGARSSLDRFWLYRMVHGDESAMPDLQREIHCDTFHETYKLWYFFGEVRLEDGPLRYVKGSHRPDARRLAWERRQILEGQARSGSMRIDLASLADLGFGPPEPVLTRPNTLVLANTRGFHCRSVAPAGTERPCVYANLRPQAFSLRPR